MSDFRSVKLNPAVDHVFSFFEPATNEQREGGSRPLSDFFYALALEIATRYPENGETTICLRKLLEAQDAANRAALSSK